MPHIIIEHSEAVKAILHKKLIIKDLMECIMQVDVFEPKTIKIYFAPIKYFSVLNNEEAIDLIHVTVKMLSGRNSEIKKKISTSLIDFFENISKQHENSISLSVDIYELQKDSYQVRVVNA